MLNSIPGYNQNTTTASPSPIAAPAQSDPTPGDFTLTSGQNVNVEYGPDNNYIVTVTASNGTDFYFYPTDASGVNQLLANSIPASPVTPIQTQEVTSDGDDMINQAAASPQTQAPTSTTLAQTGASNTVNPTTLPVSQTPIIASSVVAQAPAVGFTASAVTSGVSQTPIAEARPSESTDVSTTTIAPVTISQTTNNNQPSHSSNI